MSFFIYFSFLGIIMVITKGKEGKEWGVRAK